MKKKRALLTGKGSTSLLLVLAFVLATLVEVTPLLAHWSIHHKVFRDPGLTIRELELATRLHDDFLRSRENFNRANVHQTRTMIHEFNGEKVLAFAQYRESRRALNLSQASLKTTLADLEILTDFIKENEGDLVPAYSEALAAHASEVRFTDPVTGEVLVEGIRTPTDALDAYFRVLGLLEERTVEAISAQKEAVNAARAGRFSSAILSGDLAIDAAFENLGTSWSAVNQFLEEATLATIRAAQDVYPEGFPKQ